MSPIDFHRTTPGFVFATFVLLFLFRMFPLNAEDQESPPFESESRTDDIVRPATMLEILKSHRRGRDFWPNQTMKRRTHICS